MDEARSLAELGASLAAAAKQENTRVTSIGVLGFLELSLGNDAAALPHLEPLLDWIDSRGLGLATHPLAPYAIEALVATGRVDEASRLVDRLEAEAQTIDSAVDRGGRCARAERYSTRRTEPLERPDERWPFERARTLLVLGRLQRRAKQKSAAKQSLELARSIFDALPAPLWSERAADELARIGLRRASPDGLTESERRVAELAATGLTNREVAAQLFMSPKTVEANISRIYRKLGIKLARAAGGAAGADVGKHPISPDVTLPIVPSDVPVPRAPDSLGDRPLSDDHDRRVRDLLHHSGEPGEVGVRAAGEPGVHPERDAEPRARQAGV